MNAAAATQLTMNEQLEARTALDARASVILHQLPLTVGRYGHDSPAERSLLHQLADIANAYKKISGEEYIFETWVDSWKLRHRRRIKQALALPRKTELAV